MRIVRSIIYKSFQAMAFNFCTWANNYLLQKPGEFGGHMLRIRFFVSLGGRTPPWLGNVPFCILKIHLRPNYKRFGLFLWPVSRPYPYLTWCKKSRVLVKDFLFRGPVRTDHWARQRPGGECPRDCRRLKNSQAKTIWARAFILGSNFTLYVSNVSAKFDVDRAKTHASWVV